MSKELEQLITKRHIVEDSLTIQELIDTFKQTNHHNGRKHGNHTLFGTDWLIEQLRKQLKIVGVYSYQITLNGLGMLVEVSDGRGNTVSGDAALCKIRRYYINIERVEG
jgi:hypothetical protein